MRMRLLLPIIISALALLAIASYKCINGDSDTTETPSPSYTNKNVDTGIEDFYNNRN